MCASSGHNLGTLGRDDDTVGVDEEVILEDVGDGHGSQLQVCSLGSNHFSRFSRDNGTIWVFNKAVVDVGSHRLGSPSRRLDSSSSMDSSAVGMVDSWSGSVGGNQSTVGVTHKVAPAC